MKVTIHHLNSGILKDKFKVIDKFIGFLNSELPLKNDVDIFFLGGRVGNMTTGSRSENYGIKVLSKNRILRDIIRTLTHEWAHEYDRRILKSKKGPDIGGRSENYANSTAGAIVKKFEKKYPHLEDIMYE
jgi:hypothetical protein